MPPTPTELEQPAAPEASAQDAGHWSVRAPFTQMTPTADLMALVRARAFDPSVLDEAAPLLGRAVISTNLVDSYYTVMCPQPGCTMQTFAAQADEGRSVLLGHNNMGAPLGQSLTGAFTGSQGNGLARVASDFYVVPGVSQADDVVRLMRYGALRDVSVGFFTQQARCRGFNGQRQCALCQLNYWSYECRHLAGLPYFRDDNGDWQLDRVGSENAQVATVIIHGGQLSEYSLVYDGATPRAELVKIKVAEMADAGSLSAADATEVRSRFPGLALPERRLVVPASAPAPQSKEVHPVMPPEPRTTPAAPDDLAELVDRAAAAERAQATLRTELDAARATATAALGAEAAPADAALAALVGTLADRVRALTVDAELGRAWRAREVESALTEGVRANGPTWDRDAWAATLGAMPPERIAELRTAWAEQATAKLQGGRSTVNGAPDALAANAGRLGAHLFRTH